MSKPFAIGIWKLDSDGKPIGDPEMILMADIKEGNHTTRPELKIQITDAFVKMGVMACTETNIEQGETVGLFNCSVQASAGSRVPITLVPITGEEDAYGAMIPKDSVETN